MNVSCQKWPFWIDWFLLLIMDKCPTKVVLCKKQLRGIKKDFQRLSAYFLNRIVLKCTINKLIQVFKPVVSIFDSYRTQSMFTKVLCFVARSLIITYLALLAYLLSVIMLNMINDLYFVCLFPVICPFPLIFYLAI